MDYKTILVHCDAGRAAPARLELAATLAERHQAHLIGLHARPPFEPVIADAGAFPMDRLFDDHAAALAASEDGSSMAFAAAVKGKSVASEWRSADGYADALLTVHARYADLTVVGQNDPEFSSGLPLPPDLPEIVALGTGRPVLVVPFVGVPASFGRRVMLCWNASREAARAATDAMPLLRSAEIVTVLVVDPETSAAGHGGEPGADVATWLSRHGVNVTVQRDVAADADVGDVILSRARDCGCDLVVMGIYGHSRLRELVLGGASRTMLASMTLPVLMSH
ncbi:MAG: universal stress protein [Reyranellaceae bacterium]